MWVAGRYQGFDVPAGMTVSVVENTDKHFHPVLLLQPSDQAPDTGQGEAQNQSGYLFDHKKIDIES